MQSLRSSPSFCSLVSRFFSLLIAWNIHHVSFATLLWCYWQWQESITVRWFLCSTISFDLIYSICAHTHPDVYECGLKVCVCVVVSFVLHFNLSVSVSLVLFRIFFFVLSFTSRHRIWKVFSFHMQYAVCIWKCGHISFLLVPFQQCSKVSVCFWVQGLRRNQ